MATVPGAGNKVLSVSQLEVKPIDGVVIIKLDEMDGFRDVGFQYWVTRVVLLHSVDCNFLTLLQQFRVISLGFGINYISYIIIIFVGTGKIRSDASLSIIRVAQTSVREISTRHDVLYEIKMTQHNGLTGNGTQSRKMSITEHKRSSVWMLLKCLLEQSNMPCYEYPL